MVSRGIIDVGYGAVVGFAKRAAGEDVGGGEAGGGFYAVEKQDLVGG